MVVRYRRDGRSKEEDAEIVSGARSLRTEYSFTHGR